MKKFLQQLIGFLVPVLLLAYPLDLLLSENIKKTSRYYGETEVWRDIYAGAIHADIAVYGSSRAWVHINPAILYDSLGMQAYNFGIDGHNFWLQYLRHLEYIRHNRPPKVIIHSVDALTLEKIPDLYNMDQFLPFMLWNKNIRTYTSSYNGFTWSDFVFPLVRYYNKEHIFDFNIDGTDTTFQPLRTKGFCGMKRAWNNDFNLAREQNKSYTSRTDQASLALYERFLNECRNQHIEVILVYTPEYIEGQRFISNRAEVIQRFRQIASRHHLKFLDYSDHEICRQQRLFYNALHLNAEGADLFTRILASDLRSAKPELFK